MQFPRSCFPIVPDEHEDEADEQQSAANPDGADVDEVRRKRSILYAIIEKSKPFCKNPPLSAPCAPARPCRGVSQDSAIPNQNPALSLDRNMRGVVRYEKQRFCLE